MCLSGASRCHRVPTFMGRLATVSNRIVWTTPTPEFYGKVGSTKQPNRFTTTSDAVTCDGASGELLRSPRRCVVCPHRFSRCAFLVMTGTDGFSDANRWLCERRRLANTEKEGLAIWSAASGEDPCGGRYYRWPTRTVLPFLPRNGRKDEMEVLQVSDKHSVRVAREV